MELRPLALAAALSLAGCASDPSLRERALEPLPEERARAFDAGAAGLEGADAEAYWWLLWRAARRHEVDAREIATCDAEAVSPEFLSRRVAQARDARRRPWAPRDEAAFLRGVAMYRAGTEALANWHSFFAADEAVAARVAEFEKGWSADPEGTLRALVHYLNAEVLGARVAKKPRGLPDLDPERCVREGGGRATDLAIAGVCLLRTWGVPACLARAPLVDREPAGDVWIVVPGADLWIRPADASPMTPDYFAYRKHDRRLPKVFVCEERNEFPHLVALRRQLPFKTAYNFVYQPAADATSRLPATARVSFAVAEQPAFLSVFAGSGWLEVAPGFLRADGETDFGPCGAGILYLPTTPGPQGRPAALGHPFVLLENGDRDVLDGSGTVVEWPWAPPEGEPEARPFVWDKGAFAPAQILDREGKRVVATPAKALVILWRSGPENGGLGRPVGRPFVIGAEGTRTEF